MRSFATNFAGTSYQLRFKIFSALKKLIYLNETEAIF